MSNILQSICSQHQVRAELEAMVRGDLLGPAGGEGEELTERTVRDRYLVGVLAPSRSAGAAANGWTDLELGHGFHETKQSFRFTISEPARREVPQRQLKLNHEHDAEEVKQGLHGKKGAAKKAAPKKKAPSTTDLDKGLFAEQDGEL